MCIICKQHSKLEHFKHTDPRQLFCVWVRISRLIFILHSDTDLNFTFKFILRQFLFFICTVDFCTRQIYFLQGRHYIYSLYCTRTSQGWLTGVLDIDSKGMETTRVEDIEGTVRKVLLVLRSRSRSEP